MKPRFQLSFYPLKSRQLWIMLTELHRERGVVYHGTTLDAEETAAFWRL